jgi:hypothetical protein
MVIHHEVGAVPDVTTKARERADNFETSHDPIVHQLCSKHSHTWTAYLAHTLLDPSCCPAISHPHSTIYLLSGSVNPPLVAKPCMCSTLPQHTHTHECAQKAIHTLAPI